MLNEDQSTLITKWKKSSPPRCIPIYRHDLVLIGTLETITPAILENPSRISALTVWRNKYMRWFATQFTATEERTGRWLRQIVLSGDDHILFLLCEAQGIAVGHCGLTGIDNRTAELGNQLRGDRGGDPNLMLYAEIALLNWGFQALNLDSIYLHVFSSNMRALALHERIGLTVTGTIPLMKIETNGEVAWVAMSGMDPITAEESFTIVSMDRESLYSRYPWLTTLQHLY